MPGEIHATFTTSNQRILNAAPLVTSRGMRLADGGFERMRRRIVDDIDIIITGHDAGRACGPDTAAQRNDLLLYRHKLRHGDDDPDGRRGRFSLL